ncbi:AraC family transcriptional regulator [Chitinophaga filiformis]|uniref:AraC family transcriptional regulator n=1 Tax=Chitinophaga filiformis TaxID=104663 RepID=A0ABY4HYZ1_CHIFI|nr:helix-turn-helix transcriptional regulator [Chitinophaga filiformis]UPK68349.1 AraC family transcriptional regulator [Chitinophaga filiformis]
MSKKRKSIPVNPMADQFGSGIAIEKFSVKDFYLMDMEEAKKSHREDGHSFFLLEKGRVSLEIDFQKYTMKPFSILYLHPDQVHRIITFEDVSVSCWSINNENLHPEYLKLLEEITPAKPLALEKETFSLIAEAVSLNLKLFERKKDKLYHSLLKDSCNALVALAASQYLDHAKSTSKPTRFEVVTKAFRKALEHNYTTARRPAEYAQKLNISAPYLNECVRNITGYSASHQIQQRIILEAKRLLSHSDIAVKEIAAQLGYDDYPYFSRFFTKATGKTPIAFRNKNRD